MATDPKPARLPLTRRHYLTIGIGMALVALGFILMSTEPFIDATQFSLALYVSPVLILGGYAVIGYGILAKWK